MKALVKRDVRIIGHEFVGHIVDIGFGASGYKIGDRISGEATSPAASVAIAARASATSAPRDRHRRRPRRRLRRIPRDACREPVAVHDDISSDIASILDPFGNAVHCALSFDVVSEDVLITGAGPIGLVASAVCRHIGARHIVITDIDDYRLGLAERMGASRARHWTRR